MSYLQPYDIFMLAVLAVCTIHGAIKGLAWQVAALAAILLSAGVAAHFSGPLAPMLGSEAPWNRLLAMLILYVGTSLGVWFLFHVVKEFINRLQLKEFDRQMGGLLGAVKGVLWCIVITFFAVTLSESARQTILRSRSGYYIAVATARAAPVLPDEIRAVLGKYIEELDRKLDPNTPAEQTPLNPLNPTPATPSPASRRMSASQSTEAGTTEQDTRSYYYVIVQSQGIDEYRFTVTGTETVLNAIARIGGLPQVSDKKIWIDRPAPDGDGARQILMVDRKAITAGGQTATNHQIMPGDRLFIVQDLIIEDNAITCINVIPELVTARFEASWGTISPGGSTTAIRGYQTMGRDYNRSRSGL